MRRALAQGLPGHHHFYLTFKTRAPGVEIPPYLVERYPEEMTIVLQYQYWNLEVEDQRFSVMLSFNDIRERLVVPFEALPRNWPTESSAASWELNENEPKAEISVAPL